MEPDPDIGIRIEDPAWLDALPDCEAVCLRAAATAAALRPDPAGVEMALMLTDDATVRDLNRTYRHQDKSTNVLSFPGDDGLPAARPPGRPRMLGDVVLAFGTVAAEASAQGKPLAAHLTHLVVHGVLHLLGYDHESDGDAEAMETLEIDILAGLGFPDPYQEATLVRHEAVGR